ncbi:MoaD/ThiS family protein [Synechococcus sp. CS-1329]|nr:MoaD/ThiS family protein [Synechococcus sp. CS-1329]MCT0218749.1 MoaD/ThiS family protein [Synechococcus sp. CS-1329]
MIHVRLFAGLREQAGWGERSLAISAESPPDTPAGLWRQLGLGETVPPQVRVAVNQAFAALDQPLQPGDEVAFLPPISGG